ACGSPRSSSQSAKTRRGASTSGCSRIVRIKASAAIIQRSRKGGAIVAIARFISMTRRPLRVKGARHDFPSWPEALATGKKIPSLTLGALMGSCVGVNHESGDALHLRLPVRMPLADQLQGAGRDAAAQLVVEQAPLQRRGNAARPRLGEQAVLAI